MAAGGGHVFGLAAAHGGDPCCGSGHFLVEALAILAALRQEEEGLSREEAACAVLRDNLHGLEIDGRCVQIAAFNVALAAWRLAGGQTMLPLPHIAWVGAPPPLPRSEFIGLANGDAELTRGLAALHDLFRQAPLLGSLIELTGGDLVDPTRVARLDQSIAALVKKMRDAEPERAEGTLAASGMADAAAILARHFTLQATNVPFLGRGRQEPALANYLKARFDIAKADLATVMLTRMRVLAAPGGTVASVTPQNWLFLGPYKRLREAMLTRASLAFAAVLGEHGFDSSAAAGAFTALMGLTETLPDNSSFFAGLDASEASDPAGKAAVLREAIVRVLHQAEQQKNPNSIITIQVLQLSARLGDVAESFAGVCTGDYPRFGRALWEVCLPRSGWELQQTTSESDGLFGGCSQLLLWEQDKGKLRAFVEERLGAGNAGSWLRGHRAWNRGGVAVKLMRQLPVKLYLGTLFDDNVAVIVPDENQKLAAVFAYCSSDQFASDVRKLNQKVAVKTQYLLNVPFDAGHWTEVAAKQHPNGLPEPYSDDPTQWLFHGHPRYAEPGTELHVALARLAGYCWPAESDAEMRLSAEARSHIAEAAALPQADTNGLLALVPVLGERPLADRLRAYCSAAWGNAWQAGSEATLIAAACERAKDKPPKQLALDAWLLTHAARQHAKLFHDRPFLWWITDGRPDGFTAVAHYHRLTRANLERFGYTVLGDWIARLGDDPRAEAARVLQAKLARILEGEKPYDIFVRWKPLEKQPLGWEPDLDDGVRLNIRPFVEAGVLAHVPKVKYTVDRGKDVASAPWFAVFNGKRRNDHHTTLAEKHAACAKAAE